MNRAQSRHVSSVPLEPIVVSTDLLPSSTFTCLFPDQTSPERSCRQPSELIQTLSSYSYPKPLYRLPPVPRGQVVGRSLKFDLHSNSFWGSGEPYASAISFYTEQLANPSVSSAALLVGRGVVRILRGELAAARSDLEEAESVLSRAQISGGADEVLAGMIVAAGLGAGKRGDAEELWR